MLGGQAWNEKRLIEFSFDEPLRYLVNDLVYLDLGIDDGCFERHSFTQEDLPKEPAFFCFH